MVTYRTVKRKGIVIELHQFRAAQRTEFLVFGEKVEFVIHGNVGCVVGIEGERGLNVVPHSAPPIWLILRHNFGLRCDGSKKSVR